MTSKNCHLNSSLAHQKIGFIGAGNMAQAIIKGLVEHKMPQSQILCANPSNGKLDHLKSLYPDLVTSNDNAQIAELSDIIIIAVKPQKIQEALQPLRKLDLSNKLLISVAAGVEIEILQSLVAQATAAVRTMPNTPSSIGLGATGTFANLLVTEKQKAATDAIFNAVGINVWVGEESQMDLVTAIAGSAPAYFFLFIEAMVQSATAQGMDSDSAKALVLQTAIGASQLAQSSSQELDELRSAVTSPGGTTAAALASFADNNFTNIIDHAIKAAVNRGQELATMVKDNLKE